MTATTRWIYFVGKPDDEHDRVSPGETYSQDEGGVMITSRTGRARRRYPWHAIRAIFEEDDAQE